MAGTVSVSYNRSRPVRVATVTWESDGDGNADGTVTLNGQIVKVTTNPGTAAPTADYDITLVDDDGIDIAQGLLADRHTSNSEEQYLYVEPTLGGTGTDAAALPLYHAGEVTFTVANAGNTKAGVAKIYMYEPQR
jgi:hypothetical protein